MKVQYIKPQTEILLAEPQELMDNTYGHDINMPEAKEQSVVEEDLSFPHLWDDNED